jgi:hypothetical protein
VLGALPKRDKIAKIIFRTTEESASVKKLSIAIPLFL